MKNEMENQKKKEKKRNLFWIVLTFFSIIFCLNLISAYDWNFSNSADYIYNASEIIVSGGNAYLNGTISTPVYSWWHLNEGSGTFVNDSSGNNRNGTNLGSPTWVSGKLGNALQFNGLNQYVDFGNLTGNFERTQSFSVELWFKTSSTGTGQIIISKILPSGSFTGWEIYYDGTATNNIYFDLISQVSSSMLRVYCSPSVVADNNWHHLVITYDGSSSPSGVKFYFDGVLKTTGTTTNTLTSSILTSTSLQLDGRNNGGTGLVGSIDEVVIYNGTLIFDKVNARYNSGNGTENPVGDYSSGYYTIQPKNNFSLLGNLGIFNETSIKISSSIGYCISNDTLNFKYWGGSSWLNSTCNSTQINNASVINSNIGTFANSGNFTFKAILHSDNGVYTPYLDNIYVFYPQPNITFISQSPADINSVNLFGSPLNINYSIISNAGLNQSTIFLYYKTNRTNSQTTYFENGTAISGFQNKSFTSNFSDFYLFRLFDNQVYPATYNINETLMENTPHTLQTLTTASDYASIELLNVSNSSQYSFFEIMANRTTGATALRYYYCNSSYVFGVSNAPDLNSNCYLFYSDTDGTYNHTHTQYSSHKVAPFPINITTGSIGGIKITSISYFMIRGATNWQYYYINNTSRANAIRLTNNNAVSWNSQNYTIDAHLHQFSSNETLWYYVCANDFFGNPVCSSLRNDLLDLGGLPPNFPNVYNPFTAFYHDGLMINYTQSVSPNAYPVNFYNITLLNLNFTYNQTIIANNSNNLGYIYNSSLATDGFYIIKVTACDNNSLCSDGFSSYFEIDNTFPYGDLIDPNNNSFLNDATVNFTINAIDSGSLGNLTLNIRYPNGTLIHQETIYTNETQGIFGIVYTFLSNGVYEWFYTIYDMAGNFFQSVIRTLNIVAVPIVSISYPVNNSIYDYTITHLDYSTFNGDFCWYSLDNGFTNVSSSCGTNSITGLISNNGINIWNVYVNNTLGNETYAQVIFNSTCSSPTNISLQLTSYPYVDVNISYQFKVSPFYIGFSNIKLQLTDPNNSVIVYDMVYDNVSGYVLNIVFDSVGNYNFVIYGDNICPTIVTNISGTLGVRNPYYVTVCGFNDKTGTSYKNNFAYLTAEFTNSKYNADLDQFITPLGFATNFKTSVFHTSYINGCGTLKLYEANADYILRIFDGIVTFPMEYSAPNMTKSYGTNIAIGKNTFNGTSENLSVFLSAKDINPYFWLMNIIFVILIIGILIISIFLFFILGDRPSFALIFFIIGVIGLIIGRIVLYFFIG